MVWKLAAYIHFCQWRLTTGAIASEPTGQFWPLHGRAGARDNVVPRWQAIREAKVTSKILKFKYTPKQGMIAGMREVWDKFMPGGRYASNRTEWRGKEPRSCAVTDLSSPPHSMGEQVVL